MNSLSGRPQRREETELAISVAHGLLERQAELDRLKPLIDGAATGRGCIALIEGPAGIGKTRLLHETCGLGAERGVRVLSARGSDGERQFPYGVVLQLLERVVLASNTDGDASLFEGMAAYAAPVFGRLDVSTGLGEPTDRYISVLHGLFWLTSNLAERRPLLIAVDDAHWADAPSLIFLDYLSRRLDALPIVVVLTSRHSHSGPEADLVRRIATEAPGTVLELRPLSAGATAELVRSMLGGDTTAELCRACHTATGGNPFLVHELAAGLLADGLPTGVDAASRVGQLVPDAVARHVLVRLSRLGQPSIRVARAIAVLGAAADLRLVTELAGLSDVETAGAVDRLVSADMLAAGLPLAFTHPLLGEAVYADTPPGERVLAHAQAARLLEEAGSPPERVALQLLATDPSGSEGAVATLRTAAQEAMVRGAPRTAARYLERALSEPPVAANRRDLLLELGIAESRAAQPDAADHLDEALQMTDEPVAAARIALELAGLYNLLGRFAQSADVLEHAIDRLGEADLPLRFSLEAELAVMAVTSRDARQRLARRMAEFRARAPAMVDQPAAAPLLAVVAQDLAETDGTAAEATLYAERAFENAGLLAREGAVLGIGAATLAMCDEPKRAEAILDGAISEAQARGSLQGLGVALIARAFARNRRGRIAEAEADARLSLELFSNEFSGAVRVLVVGWLADILIEGGELEEAERLIEDNEASLDNDDSLLVQQLADSRARILLLRNHASEAQEQLDAQLLWQSEWGSYNPGWTSTRSLAALACLAVGKGEEARSLAVQDLEAARSFGAPRSVGIALRVMGLVGAEPEIEVLRESVEVLERSEARLELARTLVALGAALRRTGARREAREPLRRGLEFADECGGALVAQRAREELLASGARPRPRRSTGKEALTPSERRVAALAKEGLSNREIAQALFLSPKTVEMHLSHVYRKLAIRGRLELTAVLAQEEGTGD